MKSNKTLIIIGIILLNILVIYMVGQSFFGKKSPYELKVAEAREYAEKELCSKSITAYKEALTIKPSVELNIEMLSVFEKGIEIGEFQKSYKVFSDVMAMVESYREDVRIYEGVCAFLAKYEEYEKCATILMQADDLHLTSKELSEVLDKVRYQYKKSFTMYTDVSQLYNDSYLVKTDDKYSFLGVDGSTIVDGNFDYASSFSENYAFVRLGNEEEYQSFVIDKNGVRQFYLDGVVESSGVGRGADKKGNQILLLAGKKDGRYKYYDMNGEEAFGDYVFAGRFRNNIAAVQESEGQWKLINAMGEAVTDTVFQDVILNEFDECAPKGLIIAKEKDKYHIYDAKCKKIGDFSCDDAKAFVEDCAAFKSGDLWGFVNAEGKVIIKPEYEDAHSFSNGLGSVLKNGTWSFVDTDNKVVVEEQFEDIGYMAPNGLCFTKTNGRWSYITMYYTNN